MHAGTDPNFWGRIFNNEEVVGLFKGEPVYKTPEFLSYADSSSFVGYSSTNPMHLKNPFTQETRELYRYQHECILCGGNGSGDSAGGLELNHIWGRVSASPYNASILCHACHVHIGHSCDEHAKLFVLNSRYLAQIGYKPTPDDMQFIDDYVMPIYNEITTCLQSMNTESTSPEESIGTSRLPTLE